MIQDDPAAVRNCFVVYDSEIMLYCLNWSNKKNITENLYWQVLIENFRSLKLFSKSAFALDFFLHSELHRFCHLCHHWSWRMHGMVDEAGDWIREETFHHWEQLNNILYPCPAWLSLKKYCSRDVGRSGVLSGAENYYHYLYRLDRNQPTAWPFQHDNIAHFEQHMSKLYLHYKSILFWLFLNIQINF